MKITTDTIRKAGKIAGAVVLYGVTIIASRISVQDVVDMVRYRGNVTYSDAVDTIMNSTMFSSDKGKAVKELQKNKDSDYYRAVIRVVKSSMYSSDKIKTIAELKEEEESD